MKICIFGGTFNPIHNGHINMARKVRDELGFSRIIFIPTGDSYLKKNVSPATIRYEMVNLAISEEKGFEISDIEIKRDGPSYTADTLKEIKLMYPEDEIYMLIGEDSLRYIDSWVRPQEIFDNASILVAGRRSEGRSLQDVIDNLKSKFDAKLEYFAYDYDISSSLIRDCISKSKIGEVKDMIPDSIFNYILSKGLYV